VDQDGVPVLLHGDTPWSLIGELTREEATQYLDDCVAREFNSLIVTLVDGHYVSNPPNNAYGVAPFTTPGRFSTPNEAYFQHADWVIEEAAARGIQILLAPVYLGCCDDGWFQEVRDNNSEQDMRGFGVWVGNRYKNTPNLMFHWGNDVFPDQFPQVREKIRAMAGGLRSVDGVHLTTYHAHPGASAHDVWSFTQESWLDFNATYTYDPVWQKSEADYAFSPTTPFILFESLYENEYGTSGKQQRVQAYQALLSGAAGQFYGNSPIWHMGVLGGNWRSAMADPGRVSLIHLRALFESRAWYALVPDRSRTVLTGGLSSGDDRATAAITNDGATLIVYVPSRRTLTINLDALSGTAATAWWFNPRNGTVDAGTEYASSGSQSFTPPDTNDWVLVIDDTAERLPAPGTGTGASGSGGGGSGGSPTGGGGSGSDPGPGPDGGVVDSGGGGQPNPGFDGGVADFESGNNPDTSLGPARGAGGSQAAEGSETEGAGLSGGCSSSARGQTQPTPGSVAVLGTLVLLSLRRRRSAASL
jgi:uncharacterized protein (TIGR03382 family)